VRPRRRARGHHPGQDDRRGRRILAFIDTGITNAATEANNRLIKDAARIAFGFRNIENQRRRVRLHCKRAMTS
jgi:transposase